MSYLMSYQIPQICLKLLMQRSAPYPVSARRTKRYRRPESTKGGIEPAQNRFLHARKMPLVRYAMQAVIPFSQETPGV